MVACGKVAIPLLRLLLVLVFGVSVSIFPPWASMAAAAPTDWTVLGPQPAAATARVATPLADGAALLTGGGGEGGDAYPDAARFDPATGAWQRVADMLMARYGHAAITLADGRVLVAGGSSIGSTAASDGFVNTVEIYDPVADRWTATGELAEDRAWGFAARLSDGRVLVGGGYNGNIYKTVVPLNTAEIYDPATGRWSAAAPMRTGHGARVATALADGTILVVGGDGADIGTAVAAAERYDPSTDRWLATAPPLVARIGQIAITLADGSVLVTGGYRGLSDGNAILLAETERYVPTVDRWTSVGALPVPILVTVAAPLPDGGVLIVGGRDAAGDQRSGLVAARYDWFTGVWATVEPPPGFTTIRTATALIDGRVLVTGNYRDPQSRVQGSPGTTVSALYEANITAKPPCFAQTGQCLRGPFLAQWLRNGGLAVHGLPLTGEINQTLEDGRNYTVQYFERVRMEYHPENDPPYGLLLGQFGRQILATVLDPPTARATALPGHTYFDATGHNVAPGFAAYWEANGGLAQFGYPLSEEFDEFIQTGAPGEGSVYRVQYFERARFEYHPENAAPNDVLLGQFGRRILDESRRSVGLVGIPAVRPTRPDAAPGEPTYTEADVRAYLDRVGLPLGKVTIAGPYTIERVEFLTGVETQQRDVPLGPSPDRLYCLVTVRGSFTITGPPVPGGGSNTHPLSAVILIFDGRTGNSLGLQGCP